MLLWCLILCAGLVCIWGRILMPGSTFSGMDFVNLLNPQATLVADALGRGAWPLWNWYTWGGSPLLAAMQSAPLYPPMWVALGLFPLPYGMQLYIMAHLCWAGCGAAVAARQLLGAVPQACAFGGVAYAGSGFFLGHLEQTNSIAAISWTPWILVAMAGPAPAAIRFVGVAATVGLGLLAGHPQYIVFAVLAGALALTLGAVRALATKSERTRTAMNIVAAVAGLMVAGALAAAQAIPAQELGSLSERVRPYADPDEPRLKVEHLPSLIVPRYLQALAQTEGVPLGYTEVGMYMGMLTVGAALFGFVVAVRRRVAVGLFLLLLLAVLYAFGRAGGVAAVGNALVPFLHHSRGTARILAVALLLVAIFAAHGLSVVLSRCQRGSAAANARGGVVAGLFVAALVGDLTVTHSREVSARLVDSRLLDGAIEPVTAVALGPDAVGRVYRFMGNDSNYSLDYRPEAVAERHRRLQPNTNIGERVALCDGYEEGLLPLREHANFLRGFHRNIWFERLDEPLLALMGVGAVVTEYPFETLGPGLLAGSSVKSTESEYRTFRTTLRPALAMEPLLVGSPEGTEAFLVPQGVGEMFVAPDREWRQHEFQGTTAEAWNKAVDGIDLASRAPNRAEFRLKRTLGKFWLLQVPYPGWKTVGPDGSRQNLRPLAPLFSEASVPEGTASSVWIAFEPFSFRLGQFVSLASLTALLVILVNLAFGTVRARRAA